MGPSLISDGNKAVESDGYALRYVLQWGRR